MAGSFGFELKEFDATTLDGTYQNLGSVLSSAARKIIIFNTSNVEVYVSNDGSTNIFRIPASDKIELSGYNKHNDFNEASHVFPKGIQLTVTQVTAAGASGDVIAHIFI